MNLNEAISHCEEVALQCSDENKACALEYVQLMQWLKELRVLRQLVTTADLNEIKNLQNAWGKDWEEYFNRELCRDVTGPFRKYGEIKKKVIVRETSMMEDDLGDLCPVITDMRYYGYKPGDEVIVTIRKK